MHEEHGYWVEDEDNEEQGFLSTETDHIWSYDEKADKWSSALAAKRLIRNKRKRKRGKIGSGKGKTRKRKRPFRGGFKSYRYRSAAAHLVCLTEFEDQLEAEEQWETGYWAKGKNKGKPKGNKTYGWSGFPKGNDKGKCG